jgi:hypothetical protein
MVTKETFEAAKVVACRRSQKHGCTVHVNVQCAVDANGMPYILYVEVSDWYCTEGTVATFTNGKEK